MVRSEEIAVTSALHAAIAIDNAGPCVTARQGMQSKELLLNALDPKIVIVNGILFRQHWFAILKRLAANAGSVVGQTANERARSLRSIRAGRGDRGGRFDGAAALY
jgi:hypothetical protein